MHLLETMLKIAIKIKQRGWGHHPMMEYWANMCEAIEMIPSTENYQSGYFCESKRFWDYSWVQVVPYHLLGPSEPHKLWIDLWTGKRCNLRFMGSPSVEIIPKNPLYWNKFIKFAIESICLSNITTFIILPSCGTIW